MLARLSAFVIWALVAATVVFWGLRLFVRASAAPAYAVAVGDASASRGDLSRLLGAPPVNAPIANAAPAASSRFRLLGIVAPKYAQVDTTRLGHGVALIAVDGKMPKAFSVGAHVDGDLVLQSVSLRTVSIAAGQGAPAITLELPLPAVAATGSLPGAMIGGSPVPSTLPQPQFGLPPSQPGMPPSPMPMPVPLQRPDGNAATQ